MLDKDTTMMTAQSKIQRRQLGSSAILLSPIGLGCWQFGGRKNLSARFWPAVEEEEIRAVVRDSLAAGVNWFDTAEAYGGGESERRLAAALRSLQVKPEDILIATKWMPVFRLAGSITRSIDIRLKNLAGYPIGLYQIHQPWSFSSISSQMRAMARLVREGKIRTVGVSNFSARQMRTAHRKLQENGLSLVSNQVRYSLLHRRIEANGIIDTAKELGIIIIAYSPLAQGLLSGKFHNDPELVRRRPGFRRFMPGFHRRGLAKSLPVIRTLRQVAEARGVTLSQAALNWLLQVQGPTVVAIPGATSSAQAKENAGAMNFALGPEDMDRLNRVSLAFQK
jgi:aryl-alcohol dehydrogenase-like predicted oxidoreductase